MTILDYLKNHTLEEILENHEILLKLDPRDYIHNLEIPVTDDVIKKGFWDPSICDHCNCEYYMEGFDYYSCDLCYTNNEGVHPTRCPYEKEHINNLKNLVKDQLLTNIGGAQNE